MQEGHATSEPSVLLADFPNGVPTTMLQSGALYYRQNSGGGPGVFVAERTAQGSRILQWFTGMSPALSRDGKSIAFGRMGQARPGNVLST